MGVTRLQVWMGSIVIFSRRLRILSERMSLLSSIYLFFF